MKKILALIIFISISLGGFSQNWIPKANYGGAARGMSSAFSIPSLGKGYVVGGSDWGYRQDVWEYDTLTNSWTQMPNNFPGLADSHVSFGINGKGYVITGVSGGYQWSSDTWEFDPTTKVWTKKTSFPGVPRGYAVGFTINGKAYVGGGTHGYNFNSSLDFYEYDPVLDSWKRIANCPYGGVNNWSVGFAINGKGYVCTGSVLDSVSNVATPTNQLWEYDPGTNVWTRKADFAGGNRCCAIGFATCTKGYVGCGFSDVAQTVDHHDFWEYDPVTDTWARKADIGTLDRRIACAFAIGNTGFAGTGAAGGNYLKDWYAFRTSNLLPAINVNSASVCAGQTVTFSDTSNFAPTSWQWTFPGGNPHTSTSQNPTVQYDTVGIYSVILTASNGCDGGTQTFTNYITVTAGGILTVTANPPTICGGQSSTVTVSGAGTYTWTPATGLNATTGATVTATPTATTTYIVSSSGSGCSTGQVIVQVANNTLAGTVTAPNDTICEGSVGSVLLNGNSSDSIQWQSSTNGTTFTDISGADTTFYNAPLTQTTWYRAVVGKGMCTDTTTPAFKIFVPPALTASFTSTAAGLAVTFTSTSVGSITFYSWDFGDGGTSNATNPTHTYAAGTDTVNVCLTIYDGSNCSFTFCKDVMLATGIENVSAAGKWNIYPSPFTSQLFIESKTGEQMESVMLYDVLGRNVFAQATLQGASQTTLSLNDLAQGVYFLKIKTTEGTFVKKVVKE